MSEQPSASPPWEFDRYRDGQIMAEGIRIQTATNEAQAVSMAASQAERGDILVLRVAAPPKPAHEREPPHCASCSCPPYEAEAVHEPDGVRSDELLITDVDARNQFAIKRAAPGKATSEGGDL